MSFSRTLIDVRPLRTSPAFRRLLIGRTVSVLGSVMTMVTVVYQVWDMTRSTVWTGAVGLAQALPLVVFGLFAGSWADRSDRRRIFLSAQVGQAAVSLLLAVQGFTGRVPVAGVLGLVAAQSCCGAVAGPAAGVFVPRLLPKDQVAAGLALQQVSFQATMLAGPALGGILLGWAGVGPCYLLDALSFGLAFYGAFGLPALAPEGEPSRTGLHGVLDGLRFLAGHRAVRGALITDLAATVLSMPLSLFPLVNAERFGGSPRTLGLFLSALAVGGVFASALSGTITRLGRPGPVMLGGAGVWGAALAAFGLVRDPWAGLALLALAGAGDSVSVISRSTIVQTHTPDALLGRVTAAEQIVGQAGPNLGNLRGGVVAGWTSGATALVSGGLACLCAVLWVGAKTPELRRGTVPEPGAATSPPDPGTITPTPRPGTGTGTGTQTLNPDALTPPPGPVDIPVPDGS
ncbi:MFS transporter [Streptomyces sp. NPDC059618]|uniref:MFS transporter n=1 Tax=Streptomyces sp. NPDC059618 TaxID=3346887 RepID=UPI0036810E7C